MSQSKYAEMQLNEAINVFTKTLLWKLTEGHHVSREELDALNSMRTSAGMEPIDSSVIEQHEQEPERAFNTPPRQEKQRGPRPESGSNEPPAGSGQGMTIYVPRNAVFLKDNAGWTNRFDIKSESSDNLYRIAQNKHKRYWGCSCPGWISHRNCKHLRAMGLPGKEQPFEVGQLKKASKTAAEMFAADLIHSDNDLGKKLETVPGEAHIDGPEAGPSNDELHENQHEESGIGVVDGDLKSPERANMNAMREALETQVEMEVGKPIDQKQQEVAVQEKVQDKALAQGAGGIAGGGATQSVSAKPGTQIIINVASKKKTAENWGEKYDYQDMPADLEKYNYESYQDDPNLWYVSHFENGAEVLDAENLTHEEAYKQACALEGVCPACGHRSHNGECGMEFGDREGGEGMYGPEPAQALPPCACMYGANKMGAAYNPRPEGKYPSYTVNGRIMRGYEDANQYWQVHGGVMMEKLDAMTPAHVLQQKPLTSSGKVGYVANVPGHKDSKGNAAPWVVKDHTDDHIISSYKTKGLAESGLKNMEIHKGGSLKEADDKEAGFYSQRVRVTEGSGLDSGEEGYVIPWTDPRTKELREEYPFVAGRNPNEMGWIAIVTDEGRLLTVPKTRAQQVKRSAEPIGGEHQSEQNAGGMFGGTDLNGPSFHVGYTLRGKRRTASFSNFVQTAKFIKEATDKFGAKDWTMKGAAVDIVQRNLVLEMLKGGRRLTTGEIEKALGGHKYTNKAYAILQELAGEGLVQHKQMRWSLKQASATQLLSVKVKIAGDGMAKTEHELEKEAGFNLFFPGQVLQEFYPELQHDIVDFPNQRNDAMGLETPDIVGDGGHELEGVLDSALDTNIIEMIQLPGDVSDPMAIAAADYSSTSPAGGMGIGRDGKPEVLEGVPLRKENDIRGMMFTDEFYGQYEGIPGAAMAVASMKTAAEGDEKSQFGRFVKLVCGEIAATMVAAFKVTQRPLLNHIPGVGEIQLDQLEVGSQSLPTGAVGGPSRVKALLSKLNDSDIKGAINGAWAQAAVWNDSDEGGFVYEVFVRPETIDTDSCKMTYKFVAGTRE